MRCPACTSEDVYVSDSRSADTEIKRRRQCKPCGHRWNTVEHAVMSKRNLRAIYGALGSLERAVDRLAKAKVR